MKEAKVREMKEIKKGLRKGTPGYISRQKKAAIAKAVIEFGIVAALLTLGIVETGSRMNLLTVIAVLGCLPAGKALIGVIMIVPHHSISPERAEEIESQTEGLTVAYDMVFTSEKNIMPVPCVVIRNQTVCGYAENSKVDVAVIGEHIKKYLYANQFTNATVKIFDRYENFLARAEEMSRAEQSDKESDKAQTSQEGQVEETSKTKKKEEAIKRVILNLSL